MLGYTHAVSGAASFLAAAPLLDVTRPVDLAVGAVVTAGAAMVPDLDHPSATIARTFGWPTRLLARGVAHISGGHRQATHSLLGAAIVAGIAWCATLTGPPGVAVLVTLALGLGVRALGWTAGGVVNNAGTFLACAGLAMWSAPHLDYRWLPAAYALGALAHIAGDCATEQGCPLAWPHQGRAHIATFDTGAAPERYLVAPLLAAATVALAAIRLGWWPQLYAAGEQIARALA